MRRVFWAVLVAVLFSSPQPCARCVQLNRELSGLDIQIERLNHEIGVYLKLVDELKKRRKDREISVQVPPVGERCIAPGQH